MLLAFTVNVAPDVDATPAPVICTVTDGLTNELFAITNCPVFAPAAAGVKWTLTVAVPFGAMVSGNVLAPSTEKVLSLTLSCDTTTAVELEFTNDTWAVAGLPMVTFPKATAVGEAVMLPALAAAVPFETTPPQPASASMTAPDIKQIRTERIRLVFGLGRLDEKEEIAEFLMPLLK